MRRAFLFGLLWTVACGDPLLVGAPEDAGASEAPEPEPAPEPAPRAEPAPEPSANAAPAPPPPDPEAEARARAEAARAAFEARFPNHGVTYHFLARVRGRPHHEGPIVGYMRRGSRFRASERVPGVGCARGWFEVPGGGFVCRGEGFKIGAEPQTFEPAPQPPALEGALPYSYAYAARDDVAQFWRLPSEAEESEVAEAFAQLRRAAEAEAEALSPNPDAGVPAPPASEDESEGAPSDEATADEADDEATEDDAPEAAASAAEAEAPPPPGTEGNEGEESAPADAAPDPSLVAAARGELTVPDYVRLRMRRGFYVSLDGEERDGGRAFYRTVRGAYVRSDTLIPSEPPTHRGVVLGGPWQLPVGFVFR
ncbi:MAG TPA: hypothetical protein RMH80_33855, partial [Polyangiaceae bacterium LLY-WYZ-15_(1-7)]|nr:hypothetical protein [Polyangiaceae bacterium LLY-WYZ-15_(1-7)]